MPCCGGPVVSEEEVAANKAIEVEMKNAKKKLDSEIKLLLLGAGESGKSTIAKQMKIIHQEGFSLEERVAYKGIIYNNVIYSMKTLIEAAGNLGINISNQDLANQVLDNASEENFVSSSAKQIKELWQDEGIKETYSQSAKFQLTDSAGYYFDIIDELSKADYVPSEQHVLRSRAKTTGIIEIEFAVGGTSFRMVDVGGQRSERKKWLHCFQEVTAVIFCVALSEYDLKLQEDDTTNRMHESVKLFKEICNSVWFKKTSMILFLNKKDLFAEKIQKVDLNVCFPEYSGGLSYENGTKFIKEKFERQNENPKKAVYIHITCATDTDNVKVVFNAVRDTIIRDMMAGENLM